MGFSLRISVTLPLLLGLVTIIYSECPCSSDQTVVSGSAGKYYDTCTMSGTFKSKSVCYTDIRVTPNKVVPPYQFYTCVPYGSSFILYPRNCTGPFTVFEDTAATDLADPHVIWNAYNSATGKCDLANPKQVGDPMAPGGTTEGWPFCPVPT